MSKRLSSDEASSVASSDDYTPKLKRRRQVEFEPVRICSISGVKDIEARVLKAQHFKLCERFRHKEKLRQILEKRVEELEGRQAKDDEVTCIINRHWNRLDEDARLLLQRFDADATLDPSNRDGGEEEVKHFLAALSNWSAEEVDDNLRKRVEFSLRALSKLVQVFDKVVQKNSHLSDLISGKTTASTPPPSSVVDERRSSSPNEGSNDNKMETQCGAQSNSSGLKANLDEELRKYATDALTENVRLQRLVTRLQSENHRLSMQSARHDDQISTMENRVEAYSNKLEDLKYELTKALMREEKLDYRLAEYVRKEQQTLPTAPSASSAQQPTLSSSADSSAAALQNGVDGDELATLTKSKLEELQHELDTQTELASNRLSELQEMNEKNKSLTAELESAQAKLKCISPDVVKASPDYQALQTNYSCLVEDCRNMQQEVDELRQQLLVQKLTYTKHIERLKSEENSERERSRENILKLEKRLDLAEKDYEQITLDVEQTGEQTQQADRINEQLATQIVTLKAQNAQLKLDVNRYKRKWSDGISNLAKFRKELESERKINNDNYLIIKLEEDAPEITSPEPQTHLHPLSNNLIGSNNGENVVTAAAATGNAVAVKQEADTENKPIKAGDCADCAVGGKDNNGSEGGTMPEISRLRLERDKLKERLRTLTIADKKERVKYYADQARLKIRLLEENVTDLQKQLKSAKQEEDGLMNEMDSTGQAFEEMQEQNQRLVLQLKEVEEVKLKMITERIRDNHVLKKMKEERELQDQLIGSFDNQIAAKSILLQKMEEKLKALTENKGQLEGELRLRDQVNDSLRRKALESTQSANDLRLRLDKMTSQLNDIQENVTKKSATYESSFFKIKRLEEDKRNLKRQLARLKEMEKFENIDQLLQEENRQLREILKCPSCKTNPKNAILTKCYHVFCFECIKLRYDTRRRKCPECNCRFGANDFRRVYIQ